MAGIRSKADSCRRCLEARDYKARCLERACATELDNDECYLANCPKVAGCFGGYDLPDLSEEPMTVGEGGGSSSGASPEPGGAGQVPAPAIDPDALWFLSVLSAKVPEEKPNQDAWDIGGLSGWAPPDVIVQVQVGSLEAPVWRQMGPENNSFPEWDGTALLMAPRRDFERYVSITLLDEDALFDDLIGVCEFAMNPSHFNTERFTFRCNSPAGAFLYDIDLRLTPTLE